MIQQLFDFVLGLFTRYVSFLFNFILGDIGFSYGFAVLGFFILSLLITYLIPGVSSHVQTISNNRK